jgi:hypothetical protein
VSYVVGIREENVMKLKTQVKDFLMCGGYRSAETAQSTALARRGTYQRLDGEITYGRALFGDFSGFEIEEYPAEVLVRFVGPAHEENQALEGYARVLENCGFVIERGTDPQRGEHRVIRIASKV